MGSGIGTWGNATGWSQTGTNLAMVGASLGKPSDNENSIAGGPQLVNPFHPGYFLIILSLS
ncbi:MAG: hypothetical protein EA362_01795 [Saprospirales bacterium]|nr:MAG: hypothetical protein EA362_01795 [Saprospirales bacterium]